MAAPPSRRPFAFVADSILEGTLEVNEFSVTLAVTFGVTLARRSFAMLHATGQHGWSAATRRNEGILLSGLAPKNIMYHTQDV